MQDQIIAVYEKEEFISPLRERLKFFSFDDVKELDKNRTFQGAVVP